MSKKKHRKGMFIPIRKVYRVSVIDEFLFLNCEVASSRLYL